MLAGFSSKVLILLLLPTVALALSTGLACSRHTQTTSGVTLTRIACESATSKRKPLSSLGDDNRRELPPFRLVLGQRDIGGSSSQGLSPTESLLIGLLPSGVTIVLGAGYYFYWRAKRSKLVIKNDKIGTTLPNPQQPPSLEVEKPATGLATIIEPYTILVRQSFRRLKARTGSVRRLGSSSRDHSVSSADSKNGLREQSNAVANQMDGTRTEDSTNRGPAQNGDDLRQQVHELRQQVENLQGVVVAFPGPPAYTTS